MPVLKERAKEDYVCDYCGFPLYKGELVFVDEEKETITCSIKCNCDIEGFTELENVLYTANKQVRSSK